jgi:hypothetical protein
MLGISKDLSVGERDSIVELIRVGHSYGQVASMLKGLKYLQCMDKSIGTIWKYGSSPSCKHLANLYFQNC